ncbi:hypothetical protein D9757_012583 [Collybiopsis confluens]|uniref:Uncharacterized protein n=1 Tax=Collybiopsis confluens TaxID=2823264 RepID=A0A8H5D0D6_9AGAR|nr:hypothetical protein D9757_012583 [Collybiopsis confluens]
MDKISHQLLHCVVNAAQETSTQHLAPLAAVALSIYKTFKGIRVNRTSSAKLTSIVLNTVKNLYNTYQELPKSSTNSTEKQSDGQVHAFSVDPVLDSYLHDLLRIFEEIDKWMESQSSRSIIRQVFSPRSNSKAIQRFIDRLSNLHDNFQVRSCVDLHRTASRLISEREALEHGEEQRNELTRQILRGIHSELDAQTTHQRPSTSMPLPFTNSLTVSKTSSLRPFPPLVPSTTSPTINDINPSSPQATKNSFAPATRSALSTDRGANISIQNIFGDHIVTKTVDNSRRENFGNVYLDGGRQRHCSTLELGHEQDSAIVNPHWSHRHQG